MELFYRILYWVKDIPRSIKHIFQKTTRGFSDETLWNLSDSLSDLIYPRLKAFKESKRMGFPESFAKESTAPLWEETLDKMLFAFEFLSTDGEQVLFDKHFPKGFDFEFYTERDEKESLTRLLQRPYPPDKQEKWDSYMADLDSSMHKVQEGLELFGKNFQNLWD